jgi:hypothetical protein
MTDATQTMRHTSVTAKCPFCPGKHTYDLDVLIEEIPVVDAIRGASAGNGTHIAVVTCGVICPEKNAQFVIDVPVTLTGREKVVEVTPS